MNRMYKHRFVWFLIIFAVIAGGILLWWLRAQHAEALLRDGRRFAPYSPVGMWMWQPPEDMSFEQKRDVARNLVQKGIHTVYTDISALAYYEDLPDQEAREATLKTFRAALHDTVRAMKSEGIAVHGLAGNKNWALREQHHIPLKIVRFARSFNQEAAPNERLSGLQFDIEAHSRQDFTDNADTLLQQQLIGTKAIIDEFRQVFGDEQCSLGFALPAWLDGSDELQLPAMELHGTRRPYTYQVMHLLSHIPDGYVALMAYRNYSGGPDGTIALSQRELDYAKDQRLNTKVFVGQETTEVEPRKITFFGQNKTVLRKEANAVSHVFRDNPAFGGIIVHDSVGFAQLKD